MSESDYASSADEIDGRCELLGEGARVSADELLAAARMQRATASPGPDGWSGGYLRRIATLFPRETAQILWAEFNVLRKTRDSLMGAGVMDSTTGGIPKPSGGNRPIVIARVVARCVLAHVVQQARGRLKAHLERGRQYALRA